MSAPPGSSTAAPAISAAISGSAAPGCARPDALYCGFATHVLAEGAVEPLVEALGRTEWRAGAERQQLDAALSGLAIEREPAPLAALRPAIDRCFAGDTIEAILAALAAEAAGGGAFAGWAAQTRAGLLAKSPTSLKVTLRQLQIGADYDLDQALILEYRLTQHMMAGHDFYEGVRAALIDKDQKPRWRPATLCRNRRGDDRRLFFAAR